MPDARSIRQQTGGRDRGPATLIPVNNPLERIKCEIRRRTRVVVAFPDGQSCLNLAAARLRHITGTQWSMRRDTNMDPLKAAKAETGAAVA